MLKMMWRHRVSNLADCLAALSRGLVTARAVLARIVVSLTLTAMAEAFRSLAWKDNSARNARACTKSTPKRVTSVDNAMTQA
jgi:hypothetical protein